MSRLPTGVPGAVFETNTDEEAAVAAWPCPVLPGEPVHPAAAAASTTPSQAYPIRRAAFLQAGRPALSWAKPPAEVTQRRRRNQNQFISARPSQWAWYGHSKQERASVALTRDYGLIAPQAEQTIQVLPALAVALI